MNRKKGNIRHNNFQNNLILFLYMYIFKIIRTNLHFIAFLKCFLQHISKMQNKEDHLWS